MAPVEFWTSARSLPGRTAAAALRAEAEGWHGICFTDSQSMSGDVYVALATAAAATSRIRLATGVTNSWTRQPAVTAAAISCVQVESGGRAELGVGRGDSALARLGVAPVAPTRFADFLEHEQAYLSGQAVSLAIGDNRGVGATQDVRDAPTAASLEWYRELGGVAKVPVFAVASGPKVLRIAARLADRVALVLGADADRVRWGIETARQVRPTVPVAAYVSVLPHPDTDTALALARGIAGTYARYSAMHGTVTAPAGGLDPAALRSVATGYELTKHFRSSGHQATTLSQDFVRQFVIAGPSGYCVSRLAELRDLGVDRFHISMTTPDVDPPVTEDIRRRFVAEVMPAFG